MLSNLGIKLICLLVALLLWAQVASNVAVEQLVRLPLEVAGLSDSLAVATSRLPESVTVRIRGNRLQLLASDLVRRDLGRVQLDLSAVGPGVHRYDISVLDVRVAATPLEVVPPVALELDVQRLVSKFVPVRLILIGDLPDGVAMAGRPELVPARVTVSGPRSLVEPVEEVQSEALRLARRRTSFTQRVPLVAPDRDLRVRPIEVEVAVGIDEIIERVFEDVPVTVLSEIEPERVSLEPTMVRVRVSGAVGVVNALTLDEVSVLVPIGSSVMGVAQVPAQAVVPDGLLVTGLEPSSIHVLVAPSERRPEAP